MSKIAASKDRPPTRCQVADVGDYVLATKYDDGDHCFVGFVSGYAWNHRYLIADNDGNSQRANGFRRIEKLTEEEGLQLVAMMPFIVNRQGPSVWWYLNKIRRKGEEQFCGSCKYEKDGHCRCEDVSVERPC